MQDAQVAANPFTACALWSRVFYHASEALQKPTKWLYGDDEELIVTTRHIFAQHYAVPNAWAQNPLQEVKRIEDHKSWVKVAKVIRAVSIVLPLLDLLAALCKKIASLDRPMQEIYELIDRRAQINLRANSADALGDSVSDFAVIMETVTRAPTLAPFIAYFKDRSALNQAIAKSCEQILQLLKQSLNMSQDAFPEAIESDTDDAMMVKNVGHCIKKLSLAAATQAAPEYLHGQMGTVYRAEWEYLTSHKDRFTNYCHALGVRWTDEFRSS